MTQERAKEKALGLAETQPGAGRTVLGCQHAWRFLRQRSKADKRLDVFFCTRCLAYAEAELNRYGLPGEPMTIIAGHVQ